MKPILPILLLAFVAVAQVPLAPTNLRVVAATTDYPIGSIIPVPVVSTNGQFVAYWYSPPYITRTNIIYHQPIATKWIPEVSADGANWAVRNECVQLQLRAVRALNQPCLTCLHFTEVAATDQVRIRLVSY